MSDAAASVDGQPARGLPSLSAGRAETGALVAALAILALLVAVKGLHDTAQSLVVVLVDTCSTQGKTA